MSTIIDNTIPIDGWTPANDIWTYASATTFTIVWDVTWKYQIWDRIKLTQTTVKYFVVLKVVFSTGTTTITITGGTSYTFANAVVSLNYYSKEASPQWYPNWFNYSPTWGGFSVAPTTSLTAFSIIGSTCSIAIACSGSWTSNSTSLNVTTPDNITSVWGFYGASWFPVDNNVAISAAYVGIVNGASSLVFRKTMDTSTSWTASGGKRAECTISFNFTL